MKFWKMKIFNVICSAILCALPVATYATEECPYFSPALALCSVHAYNVGDAQNPTDTARASEIEDVIGMKTTVMVQQLKQQYDELNAVIKRFKTQLNKAVLTSKIEVITGTTSSSTNSSSGGSSYSATVLAGAEDCGSLSKADTYDCLLRNLNRINQAAEKDVQNAYKQLQKDIDVINGFQMCTSTANNTQIPSDCKADPRYQQGCGSLRANQKVIRECTEQLRFIIQTAKSNYEDSRNQSRRGW